MANSIVYVTEYSQMFVDTAGVGPMCKDPPLADYTITAGASSAQGQVFNPATRFIRMHCDNTDSGVGVAVLIGANPTATSSNGRMAPNQTEYRAVPLGAGYRVAIIQLSN